MKTIKVRGIVLKEMNMRESDKLLVIMTKEYGKILISAKNARKPKSIFLGGTQLFCYCDFILNINKNFLNLSQVELIHSFYEIRKDYEKLVYGQYILEVCDKLLLQNDISSEDKCSERLAYLLLRTLSTLSKKDLYPKLICIIFKFKFFQLNGIAPEINSCSACSKKINRERLIFFSVNGLICEDCFKSTKVVHIKISNATVLAIDYILSSDIKDIFKFKVTEVILYELWKCVNIFMIYHHDVYIKSKELIE